MTVSQYLYEGKDDKPQVKEMPHSFDIIAIINKIMRLKEAASIESHQEHISRLAFGEQEHR